jgi:hypothetical protein
MQEARKIPQNWQVNEFKRNFFIGSEITLFAHSEFSIRHEALPSGPDRQSPHHSKREIVGDLLTQIHMHSKRSLLAYCSHSLEAILCVDCDTEKRTVGGDRLLPSHILSPNSLYPQ